MPILNWIGKEQVVNHDKEVPFRLLKLNKKLSVKDGSQNLLIHGDNLEALKALMPFYYNQVKCIYIDPPYNTGSEKWVYNDKVNSPKIKQWLGKVVARDDLCKHDKWLCMMYPRLKLLRDLLRNDGVIFVSIDYNELCSLRAILDDIFGNNNYVETIIWRKKEGGGQQDDFFVTEHEYIVVYAKNKASLSLIDKKVLINREGFNFLDKKKNTKCKRVKLAKWGSGALREDRPTMHFPIKAPDGKDCYPIAPDGRPGRWRYGKASIKELIEEKSIHWEKKGKHWIPYELVYEPEDESMQILKERSIFYDIATTADGTNELTELFGIKDIFPHPKPSDLIAELILLTTFKDDIVLDSFAGSGTTGHAVLSTNRIDKENRKFILVQLDEALAKPIKLTNGRVLNSVIDITQERVKRVIEKERYEEGFQFCDLGKPLFNRDGQIDEECTFEDLARYIYFTETKSNLDTKNINGNYLGEYGETEYYLLFNGKNKNTLNRSFLRTIRKNDNKKIIYADRCLIDDEILERQNIIFKQIPYEVKVY